VLQASGAAATHHASLHASGVWGGSPNERSYDLDPRGGSGGGLNLATEGSTATSVRWSETGSLRLATPVSHRPSVTQQLQLHLEVGLGPAAAAGGLNAPADDRARHATQAAGCSQQGGSIPASRLTRALAAAAAAAAASSKVAASGLVPPPHDVAGGVLTSPRPRQRRQRSQPKSQVYTSVCRSSATRWSARRCTTAWTCS
jgi:hypothetical protein